MSRLLHFPTPPPAAPLIAGWHDLCPECHGQAWETVEPTKGRCLNCDLVVELAADAPSFRPRTVGELREIEANLLAGLETVQARIAALTGATRRPS